LALAACTPPSSPVRLFPILLAKERTLGDLVAGDPLDRSAAILAQLSDYDQAATHDLLPSGDTGFYWANGILLGSTC
jgi:hypothetical protein